MINEKEDCYYYRMRMMFVIIFWEKKFIFSYLKSRSIKQTSWVEGDSRGNVVSVTIVDSRSTSKPFMWFWTS